MPRRRPSFALAAAGLGLAAFIALTVAVVVHGGAPFVVDSELHRWVLAHRTPALVAVAVAISATGTGVPPYALALIAGALAVGARRRWTGALAALIALALGEALRYVISVAIARPRPPRGDWAHAATGFAFPSGHTTTSALVAALLVAAIHHRRSAGYLRGGSAPLLAVVAVGWAVSVGVTRIYLGVHWPTDVVGGWLLAGTLAAAAVLSQPLMGRVPGRTSPPMKKRADEHERR